MIHLGKLVEVLRDLSDADLQRQEWLENQDTTVYFPSEMLSQLFDDSGLAEHLNMDSCPKELDEEVFHQLKKLDRATQLLDLYLQPQELLASPELGRVRTLAAGILAKLAKRKS